MVNKKSNKKKKGRNGVRLKRRGAIGAFISRSGALKKLHLSLRMFRKLCILRGIYPREPGSKIKAKDKTYYYLKDISFLQYDPLLSDFRNLIAWKKKETKAKGKKDRTKVKKLRLTKPRIRLELCIKDRYPTFRDALGDLDDALCTVNLFCSLGPHGLVKQFAREKCRRLALEFQSCVVRMRSLKKVFVSIKGFYYQAIIHGVPVTWVVPHQYNHPVPPDVDIKVMLSFADIYMALLTFVNYKLFHSLNLQYPSDIDGEADFADGLLYLLDGREYRRIQLDSAHKAKQKKKSVKESPANENQEDDELMEEDEEEDEDEDEDDEDEDAEETAVFQNPLTPDQKEDLNRQRLFEGLKVFLARETPSHSLVFVIRACGGVVGWEGPNSPFDITDKDITHHIVDRPLTSDVVATREYVQPQWVYDCINAGVLLPAHEYGPSSELPPHLSPFVDDEKEGYIPERRKEINRIKEQMLFGREAAETEEAESAERSNMTIEEDEEIQEARYEEELDEETAEPTKPGKKQKRDSKVNQLIESKKKEKQEQEKQQQEMLINIIPNRKKKWIANHIENAKKRKEEKRGRLEEKKRLYEKESKKNKKTLNN